MKKLLSVITIFALVLSFSTNLYVSASNESSESVVSENEAQNNKNKENTNSNLGVAAAILVAVTSVIATTVVCYRNGFKDGKSEYWLSNEKIAGAISWAWDGTKSGASWAWNTGLPSAWDGIKSGASSAWNWTKCKFVDC